MSEKKYYAVRGNKYKSTTFNVNMEVDKRKNPTLKNIEIKGKFPKPNARLEKPGKSYLSEEELTALRRDKVFSEYEKNGDYAVFEIPFKDLPEELQKEYDIEAYKALKAKQPAKD